MATERSTVPAPPVVDDAVAIASGHMSTEHGSIRRPAALRARRLAELRINGKNVRVDVDPHRLLLSVLRDDLGLTGSHYGCGEGQCGACTVLVDGTPRRSCITAVGDLRGRAITTIEGLARDGQLHPLQRAFLRQDALQCGYCTSGMIVSGVALLRRNPNPSAREITRHMEGNVCRCGVYHRIVAAIQSVSETAPEDER